MEDSTPRGVVLIAEDDRGLRQLVSEILSDQGYMVLVASDGKNALTVARKHEGPIDLLVTDVMMPKLDGFDLREKILQERATLKILVISGALAPEIVGEDFPILRKPFNPEELIAKVAEILKKPAHKSVG